MPSMAELSYSMQMRDVVKRMVAEEIENQRPRYRYAVVNTIDRTNRKCTVTYNGETNPVTVNMGAVQPSATGQSVRIEGIGTDKFISDVMGVPWVGDTNGQLNVARLRLSSTTDVSETSTGHAFQIGADNAANVAIDNNEIQARDGAGAYVPLYIDQLTVGPQGTGVGSVTRKDYADSLVANVRNWTVLTVSGFNHVSGSQLSYMKDAFGWVHLCGRISNINAFNASAVICTFPTGYRPFINTFNDCLSTFAGSYNQAGWNINTAGQLSIGWQVGSAPIGTIYCFDGIEFYSG